MCHRAGHFVIDKPLPYECCSQSDPPLACDISFQQSRVVESINPISNVTVATSIFYKQCELKSNLTLYQNSSCFTSATPKEVNTPSQHVFSIISMLTVAMGKSRLSVDLRFRFMTYRCREECGPGWE